MHSGAFRQRNAAAAVYRNLATLVEAHILSFVLAFSRSDSGGALEVFDLRCDPDDARLLSDGGVAVKPDAILLRPAADGVPGAYAALKQAVCQGFGPWPDFWGSDADLAALARHNRRRSREWW